MTVTDLMIVKRLCDHGYTAIKDNKIRIGSINYYRDIEDEHRRDGLEGAPAIIMRSPEEGRVISSEEFNSYANASGSPIRITKKDLKIRFKGKGAMRFDSEHNFFVYCTTLINRQDKEIPSQTNHLGQFTVEITNPQRFKDMIALELLNKIHDRTIALNGRFDSVSSAMRAVVYQDKSEVDDLGTHLSQLDNSVDIGHCFIKPTSYAPEKEYRFLWLPYHNPSNTGCALPYGFKYIDIEVPGIWSCLSEIQ